MPGSTALRKVLYNLCILGWGVIHVDACAFKGDVCARGCPKRINKGFKPLVTPTGRGEAVPRVPHIVIGIRFSLLFGQPPTNFSDWSPIQDALLTP